MKLLSLFAISDLHLSFSCDKSMEVFKGWNNYTDRIEANWKRIVGEDDTVVIIGDVSWASDYSALKADMEFIHNLPGKKIIIKGNHDFWWGTMNKNNNFLAQNNFDDIKFLFNNCFTYGEYGICGSRGWVYDGEGSFDSKVISRECGRLEMSLNSAEKQGLKPILFTHYPPVYGDYVCQEIIDVLNKHQIKTLYYGHIHGSGLNNAKSEYSDIKMHLVSCDCVDFTPIYICE